MENTDRKALERRSRRNETQRLAKLTRETIAAARVNLTAADVAVAVLQSPDDARHIRSTVEAARQVEWVLTQLGANMLAAYNLKKATEAISGACATSAAGGDPFTKLFDAGGCLHAAVIYSAAQSAHSERSTPKHSASPRLRTLAIAHPADSAAALLRRLQSETGGRMDASAARAVVRKARKSQR